MRCTYLMRARLRPTPEIKKAAHVHAGAIWYAHYILILLLLLLPLLIYHTPSHVPLNWWGNETKHFSDLRKWPFSPSNTGIDKIMYCSSRGKQKLTKSCTANPRPMGSHGWIDRIQCQMGLGMNSIGSIDSTGWIDLVD